MLFQDGLESQENIRAPFAIVRITAQSVRTASLFTAAEFRLDQ